MIRHQDERTADRDEDAVQYDLNTGARGWTMICDDGVHPDRPIGPGPVGLGYVVVRQEQRRGRQ